MHLNCSIRWKDHNLKDILYDQLSKGQVHFRVFSPLCACCACMCVGMCGNENTYSMITFRISAAIPFTNEKQKVKAH